MEVTFRTAGKVLSADLRNGTSIAVDLDFKGDQPSHFGAEKATREPMVAGGFSGRTKSGAGCNVDYLRLNPHCNGTHTETIGHIVNEPITIADVAMGGLYLSEVVSVAAVSADSAAGSGETYQPEFQSTDWVITKALLEEKLSNSKDATDALIIRTLPNEASKKSRCYGEKNQPAFLTTEAIGYIIERGCGHLLVDLPSVDRLYDDRLMNNHHVFWNVPSGTHQLSDSSWREKTITEMIFVPDTIADGLYMLSLQVPAFICDVAPSRPILYPVREVNND